MRVFKNKITWGFVSFTLNGLLLAALILSPIAREYAAGVKEAERIQTEEKQWLAKAIYFEARGENSLEAQEAVAKVVLVRVVDPRWPDTVEAVVRQGEERKNRCQFSFMCDGKPEYIKDRASWETALYVAEVAYSDFISGQKTESCAHSYLANYVKRERFPYFMKLAEEKKVGRHIFYCDNKIKS